MAGWTWHDDGPPPSWERIVRPSVIIESHLRDRNREPEPEPEEEGEIIWGKPSQFQWSASDPAHDQHDRIIIVGDGGGPGPPPDEDEETRYIDYNEIVAERVTEDIRVENPSDSAQYVMVRRINEITFQGPNEGSKGQIEVFHRFILNHPAA
jgi:hypothetical protein